MEMAAISALPWTPPAMAASRAERPTAERSAPDQSAAPSPIQSQTQPARHGVDRSTPEASQARAADGRPLTPEEQRRVAELRQIDRNVRAHEAAHLAAGQGVVTSGARFGYTRGPDGKDYATSGEVGIDTSREQKPEENIAKGQRIQAAALAPLDPSAQDYRVAAIGARLEAEGYSEKARQQRAEQMARRYHGDLQTPPGRYLSVFA